MIASGASVTDRGAGAAGVPAAVTITVAAVLCAAAAPAPGDGAGDAAVPDRPGIWRPRGDTQLGPLDRLRPRLGVQYRVMYNASNLPGPANTTISDTETYDFLRQRLRVNVSLSPEGLPGGGFLQAEFRGGFGGSSPNASDPRAGEPTRNPFNRLQARGIRYGYLWVRPADGHMLLAGILPLSDGLADTLFSADWDFSVGGAAALGEIGRTSYRVAWLRLVEGVGATDADRVAEDGDLLVGDAVLRMPEELPFLTAAGLHAYYLHVGDGLPLGATDEWWLAIHAEAAHAATSLEAFAALNTGNLGIGVLDENGRVVSGFEQGDAHTGYALRLAGHHRFDPVQLDLQVIYTSGDRDGRVRDRFATPEGLLGTEGYWAFTHLFTANGPSDVNDLAVEIGNGGAGLLTVQARASARPADRLRAEVFGGWFRAARPRNGSRNMGSEVGALVGVDLLPAMSVDVGAAGGFTGGFFGPSPDDLFEIFVRWQLHY